MLSEGLKTELTKLDRVEKLQIIQWLVSQLAAEETLLAAREYTVWSPHDEGGAAAALLTLLDEENTRHG